MQDTMLLDRRTKDLVKEYVPEGDVLDSIVCFFFHFCRPYAGENAFGIGYFRNVRNGHIARSGNKPNYRFAPAAAVKKSWHR